MSAGIFLRMACSCDKEQDTLIAEAVEEISARALASVAEAMTAAASAGDERLATLEARIADLESAVAGMVAADVKVGEL